MSFKLIEDILKSEQDRNNETYAKGVHDGQNDGILAQIATDFIVTNEIYRAGYEYGKYNPSSESKSSSSTSSSSSSPSSSSSNSSYDYSSSSYDYSSSSSSSSSAQTSSDIGTLVGSFIGILVSLGIFSILRATGHPDFINQNERNNNEYNYQTDIPAGSSHHYVELQPVRINLNPYRKRGDDAGAKNPFQVEYSQRDLFQQLTSEEKHSIIAGKKDKLRRDTDLLIKSSRNKASKLAAEIRIFAQENRREENAQELWSQADELSNRYYDMYMDRLGELDTLIAKYSFDEDMLIKEQITVIDKYLKIKKNIDEEYKGLEESFHRLNPTPSQTSSDLSSQAIFQSIPQTNHQTLETRITLPTKGVFVPNNSHTGQWEVRTVKTKSGEIYEERVWVPNGEQWESTPIAKKTSNKGIEIRTYNPITQSWETKTIPEGTRITHQVTPITQSAPRSILVEEPHQPDIIQNPNKENQIKANEDKLRKINSRRR